MPHKADFACLVVAVALIAATAFCHAAERWMHEQFTKAGIGGVPFCIIHGDIDEMVPLGPNSAELKKRYEAAGRG